LALSVHDRDPDTVLIGHDELDLMPRTDRHEKAAEINPLPHWIGLFGVPRAAVRTGYPGGLSRFGRLVIGRLVVERLVVELAAVRFLASIRWTTPTKHSARSYL
jgi:hypothetical protein